MKNKKNSIIILLTVCMVFICSITNVVNATTFSNIENGSCYSEDIQLPNDANILYQDEGIVVYQSVEEDNNSIELYRENNYGNAWVNRGGGPGSFSVYNTHTGRLGVTWKVEGSSNNDSAQMYMKNPNGLTVLNTRLVKVSDSDVRFVISNGIVGNYTVNYIPITNTNGIRVMCWTY